MNFQPLASTPIPPLVKIGLNTTYHLEKSEKRTRVKFKNPKIVVFFDYSSCTRATYVTDTGPVSSTPVNNSRN